MRHTDPRAAYAARTAQIHAKLARLQQLANDHFGHAPDAVHWGHVGDLGRVEQALDDLLAIFDGQPERRRPRWKPCPKLTPTQALLLRATARRADGRVIPPANLRGGARVKAMTALMRREWIEASDGGFVLTDAGYAVAGRKRPVPPAAASIQELDTSGDLQLLEGISVRPGTKLAALVVALRRPQGATNLQLMLATGWQPHSVRGAISGLLRKRLGLKVVLTHNAAGERAYRID